MKFLKQIIFFLSVFLWAFSINAQENNADTTKLTMFDWFAFPYALYSPETNLAFGVGDVGNSLSTYKLTQLKYSYGFGLRYMLDMEERINIRFDMGFGNNTSGIYFGIEEAF